jgi:hypothetical protein
MMNSEVSYLQAKMLKAISLQIKVSGWLFGGFCVSLCDQIAVDFGYFILSEPEFSELS